MILTYNLNFENYNLIEMKRIVRGHDRSISYEDPYFDNMLGSASFNSSKYPFRLCMYEEPPIHEIRLEQLEKLAISRLKRLYSRSFYFSFKGC